MKAIYLIRHAESIWQKGIKDFDRTLTSKGIEDAKHLSKQLTCKADLIICSSATRTKQTSLIFVDALNYNKGKIDFDLSIYEAPLENLIKKVNLIDEAHNTVLFIGHNPGITQLANYLGNENLAPINPCTIIKIELEIDNWQETINGIGIIKDIITP